MNQLKSNSNPKPPGHGSDLDMIKLNSESWLGNTGMKRGNHFLFFSHNQLNDSVLFKTRYFSLQLQKLIQSGVREQSTNERSKSKNIKTKRGYGRRRFPMTAGKEWLILVCVLKGDLSLKRFFPLLFRRSLSLHIFRTLRKSTSLWEESQKRRSMTRRI